MKGSTSVVRRVKETVVRALELKVEPAELSDGEVLFGRGLGVSSIAVMEVVVALEEEFDFEVGDDELRMELFESIDSIVDYVETKVLAAAGGSVGLAKEPTAADY